MKHLYFLLVPVLLFASCTKRAYVPDDIDTYQWTRTHDQAFVSYVDHYTGNYIVETGHGYTVIAFTGSIEARENDELYAYFGLYGQQTIYNFTGNFFTTGRVIEYGLSWDDALYVLDHLSAGHY